MGTRACRGGIGRQVGLYVDDDEPLLRLPSQAGAQRVLSLFSIACHHFACRPLFFITMRLVSLGLVTLSLSCFLLLVRIYSHGEKPSAHVVCATWHTVRL